MKRSTGRIVAVMLAVMLLFPGMTFPTVADESSDILMDENFDDTLILDGLPSGWTLENGGSISTAKGGYFKVVQEAGNPSNQLLKFNMVTSEKKTIEAIAPLRETYTGDFTAAFDMTLTGGFGNRYVFFCNSAGQNVFAVGADGLGKIRIKTYNDATYEEYSLQMVSGQKYRVRAVYEHEKELVRLYVDDNPLGTFDMTRSPIAKNVRTIAKVKVASYYKAGINAEGHSLEVDNILVKKFSNQAPVVSQPIETQRISKGKELSIDLTHVFSDPEGEELTYSSMNGAIENGIYRFTPEQCKTYHEKIIAKDDSDAEASVEFDIDSMIYYEDFEGYQEGVLPEGYSAGNIALDENYKVQVANLAKETQPGNKAMMNYMLRQLAPYSTAIDMSYNLGEVYTGKIEFNTKIYTNSKTERALYLLNKAENSATADKRILSLHFLRVNDQKSKVEVRRPVGLNSPANQVMEGVEIPADTWIDLSIVMDTYEKTASVQIGDYAAVEYDITTKDGTPLQLGAFDIYNYLKRTNTSPAATEPSYLYMDDVSIKKINRAPEVASYISGQSAMAGSELVVDLSNVFTDPDGDELTLTAEHGTVEGTIYKLTPSASGTIIETITADDGLGGITTTTFAITVEDTGSDIIYQTDFETDIVGELPEGYTLNNLGTPIDPTDFRGVTDTILKGSSVNKSLLNQINVIRGEGNTNQITYGLKDKSGNYKAYTGLIEFNAQIYNEANEYEKIIYLLNSEKDSTAPPTRVMSLILNNTDSENNKNIVARIDNHQGGSKSFVLQGAAVPDKTWTDVRIVVDTENRLGQIKIGDFAPVEVSLDLKSETTLQLGGFGTYNRYRNNKKGHGSILAIDDILIRNVVGNAIPTVSGSIEPQTVKMGTAVSLDISRVFSDADGDLLGITADKGSILNGILTYTPEGTGQDDITLTAIDGKGGRVQYVIRLTVTGNAPPKVMIPVNDQYIVLGEEVSLQLNDTFSDDGQAPVVITADKGTVAGTKFSYTPQTVGTEIVTLTAADDEGAATSLKFRIVVNDPSGKDSVLFKEDFETTRLGELPNGWRLDLAAGLNQETGFYGVKAEPSNPDNQLFYIDNRAAGSGSNSAIAPLRSNYAGDFSASFDMTVSWSESDVVGDRPTRYVAFCNSTGNTVFAFGYEQGAFRIKAADTVYTQFDSVKPVSGQKYRIELDYHHAAQRVDLYIDGSFAGSFDVTRSTNAKNFSMIKMTTYFRRAWTKPDNLFLIDNLLLKADMGISDEDRLTVQKDYEDFRWEYLSKEPADSVTRALNMRAEGRYGSSVSWECSNPKVVFSNGFVARPSDGDKLVSLKATFTKGNASMSKSFDMTVKQAIASQYKKQLFQMDFEDQTAGNMPDGWTAPSDYPMHKETKITVEADPLNASNKVLKQTNHHFTPQEYSGFTGRYAFPESYNGHIILNVDYMVKQLDTQVMLRLYNDKSELLYSVGNAGAFQYAAQEGTVAVSDISLQANKWYRFRIEMFTDTGYVLWYIDDQLAACFQCSANLADNYSLKWLYLYNWVKAGSKDGIAYLDNISVEENITTKMNNALERISFAEQKDGVKEDFDLPTEMPGNIKLSWKSSDSKWIAVDGAKAVVTRPGMEETDQPVILTATAEIEGKTLSREYPLVVKRHVTDPAAVDLEFERLTFAAVSEEPQDAVTQNLKLPSKGYEDTDISWSSSDESVLRISESDGVVSIGDSNKNAVLTAVISRNGVQRTKEFDVTVLKYFGINIVSGAAVKTASSDNQSAPAGALIDGNFGKLWHTLYTDQSPSVVLDLGVKQRMDSGLISACGNVKSFELSVSNDGLNYKRVLSQKISGNAADKTEIQEFSFTPVEGRYVKADFAIENGTQMKLRELQLFHSALTDDEALRLAKALLKLSGSDRIQADIDLPAEATHGTAVTWMSSNQEVITNEGKVTRPRENTGVTLTATISRNGKSVTKEIAVTVLQAGTSMGKDPNKLEKYYGNPTSMTDEMFFGKWQEEYQDWDFDYMPKLNYDYSPELQLVGEYAKKGDYESAKSELAAYYKNKELNYHITHSSKEYDKAELYANNMMFSSNNSLIGTFTVPAEYGEISVDVSSYVKNSGSKTIYFVQKYKHEPQAEFYTREAENGVHTPELVIVANGKEMRFKAAKDTYVSPDTNQEKNFGTENRMYAKETRAEEPSAAAGGFGELWTKDTKRPYMQFNITGIDKDTRIDSAVLKVYGKADGGTSDITVWGEGNNSWKETEFNWRDAMVSVFSWNGSEKVDWIMPKNPDEGADNATYMNIARSIWMGTLTGCYNTTGDEYYAYHVIRQCMDLFEGTKDSVGAFNLQDAGIRSGTLVAAFNSLRKSEYMTDDACMAFIKNMWQLNKTLTLDGYFAPAHNHGVFSNRGQTRITLYFPEFADYEKYKELFISRWDTLSGNLVQSDGSYIEASFGYTNEVINNFLTIIDEAKTFRFPLNAAFNSQLIAVTRYLADCLQPDLTAPAYGDSDMTNYTSVIKKVADYFGLEDVKYILSNGAEGEAPDHTSVYYGGGTNKYLNLRDDWSRQGMMLATNYGFGDGKSHTHPDNMAITMFAYGRALLVDPGRYNYSSGTIADWLRRTTEAHNVVNINDTPQSNKHDTLNQFYTNDKFDYVSGTSQSTAAQNGKSFDYKRTILFPKSKFFLVSDKLVPPNEEQNRYDQNWHFLPDSKWTYDEDSAMLETHFESGANLIISQVDKSGFEMIKQDGYYSGKQGTAENTKFPTFRQEKAGNATFDTVLYPKPAGDTSRVETARIPLDVQPDTATAFSVDVIDGEAVQKNVFYQTYETAYTERQIGTYRFDGQAMLIEKKQNGKLAAFSVVNGSKLTVTEDGKESVLMQYTPKSETKLTDLSVTYNFDCIELESSVLNLNNISGLTLYATDEIKRMTVNGEAVDFTRNGTQLSVDLEKEIGEGKIAVTSYTEGKTTYYTGTANMPYTSQISYSYGKRYQASAAISAGSKLTRPASWDGTLPKINVAGKSPRTVDGQVKAYLSLDKADVESTIPYEMRIEMPSGLQYDCYQGGKKVTSLPALRKEGIEAANSALSGNAVGVFQGSGYIVLYSRMPIDVTLYTKNLTPPNNNGGGGGGGTGPVTPTTPPTTEPTAPPTTEPTAPPTTEPFNGFEDTKGHWAEAAIDQMHKIGVVNGIGEKEFSPDTDVTRAEFAAMIARLLGLKNADSSFADVPSDAWYNGSVGAVAQANIMIGADGTFRPDDKITREEMTKVLVEAYAQKKGAATATEEELAKFTDKSSISDWATLYMAGAVKLGLISGMTETTIAPQENATRAQAAMMFKRLYDLIRF